MHIFRTSALYAATLALAHAAALPVARENTVQMQARAGGGIGDILKDHVKYVASPPSAAQPIPAEENNALRETHRQAHETIFKVMKDALGGQAGKQPANKEGKAGAQPE